jgi:glycogen phosphorylase
VLRRESLERDVVPQFYERDADGVPRQWIERVRRSIATLTPRFDADRMVREYTERAYLPASKAYLARWRDAAARATALCAWKSRIAAEWPAIRFLRVQAEGADGRLTVEAHVYLAELPFDDVVVNAYAEPSADGSAHVVALRHRGALPGTARPAADFTARVVPHHPDAFVPIEACEILWSR